METTTLNPQYIYVQATEPSDKTQGKIWYNTTANVLYSSDGTNYNVLETDVSKIYQLIELKTIPVKFIPKKLL